ncbi:MAG: cell division protein ZapA [Thermodesulfobacteriota bacterium]
MKKNIDIEILGQKYTIKSDEEEVFVYNIVDYLNKKIEEVLRTTTTVDTLNAIVVVALNITSDLFRIKNEEGYLRQQIENKSGHLISLIDSYVDNEGNISSNN